MSSTEDLDEQVLEGESLWKKVVHVQTVADLVLDMTRFDQFWMSENGDRVVLLKTVLSNCCPKQDNKLIGDHMS